MEVQADRFICVEPHLIIDYYYHSTARATGCRSVDIVSNYVFSYKLSEIIISKKCHSGISCFTLLLRSSTAIIKTPASAQVLFNPTLENDRWNIQVEGKSNEISTIWDVDKMRDIARPSSSKPNSHSVAATFILSTLIDTTHSHKTKTFTFTHNESASHAHTAAGYANREHLSCQARHCRIPAIYGEINHESLG